MGGRRGGGKVFPLGLIAVIVEHYPYGLRWSPKRIPVDLVVVGKKQREEARRRSKEKKRKREQKRKRNQTSKNKSTEKNKDKSTVDNVYVLYSLQFYVEFILM